MEMEGRGLSELFRNTSEEIFLKAVMENSIGVAAPPSMEMMGFRNMSQSFREDSEELFNSWLMNGEIPGFGHLNNRPRQPSRLSSEAAALPTQQHEIGRQNFLGDNLIPENSAVHPEYSINHNQQSLKNAAEKGMQASDLLLAKTWFHCTQPMTRSRSSELRRRYAAMQTNVPPITVGTTRAANQLRLDFTNTNATNGAPMGNTLIQTSTFVSPSCSSTSPLDSPHMVPQDTVTSVVSMLKDTLERKKHGSHTNKDIPHGNSFGFYDNQQFQHNTLGGADIFPLVATSHVQDSLVFPEVEGPTELNAGNFVTPANQIWISAASREPSQSGSSTAMTAQSAGFEVCDELRPMGQALSACESTRRNAANGTADCRSTGKEYIGKVLQDNLKDDKKRVTLTRMGSISSEQAVDRGDPTKKRRVERTRKMAEAKERSSTPVIPSDMQAVLKRCENLEKEVRSLKLNLSFMNRKDSEQTKQIEDLQQQNEEMAEEKERLQEEIERMASNSAS
ncbi:protein CYCLOPS-like [Lolium rigidum]|uniref:protein CYCLOPS-like n=1 Tax=Lolium rigidum TaxID=89674 RepID=UPI001F5E1D34|nr:protein CYCLOPS-like [Lolium rigidum]XP_047061508.1 protein CYCLOPS-like [Lolium rigidum]